MAKKNKNWFNSNGWFIRKFPSQCVKDCSAMGSVDESVKYWIKKLGFFARRDLAIEYLDAYDWDEDNLNEVSQETLNERILWLACCDIKENKKWFGLVH